MKILYTPLMIVPSLTAAQRAAILDAAGPGATLVEAKDRAVQRAEIVDADVLFGRVSPEIFPLAKRLKLYHSIGAGVDAVLSHELVQSDVPLASGGTNSRFWSSLPKSTIGMVPSDVCAASVSASEPETFAISSTTSA